MGKIVIGHPRRRLLPVRLFLVLCLCFFYAWKKLHLPRGIFTRQPRSMMENWTDPMFGVVIRSLATRAYIDQTCSLKKPADCRPLVAVEGPARLSRQEVEFFYDNGYLPAFDVFPAGEIEAFGRRILAARETPSAIYGFRTDRDRHLEMPAMMRLMRHPAILERCAQLLGPDLLCWRSQFFYKPPRGEAVQWHQASSYMVEDAIEPALRPPDRDQLFQLTIWCAVDAATKANGCLRVIPGTQEAIRTIRFGGEQGFYHSRYQLEYDTSDERAVYLEAEPGQVIIFSERTVHGSSANATDGSRSAFNFRLIRPDTKVYANKTYHRAAHMNQSYSLERWGCVLMRGEDRIGLNRLVSGPAQESEAPA